MCFCSFLYSFLDLFLKRKVRIFENQVSRTLHAFHFFDHGVGGESIEGFRFGYADIEEVFFESEILSGDFMVTDIVSFCCVDIENPDVVDSEDTDEKECKDIRLSKAESVILPRSFSL